MVAGSILVCAVAWFYPQMDLEIYRLNKMWEESDNVGMRAAHPGEVASLRDHVDIPSADVLSLTKLATQQSDTKRSMIGADYFKTSNSEVYSR